MEIVPGKSESVAPSIILRRNVNLGGRRVQRVRAVRDTLASRSADALRGSAARGRNCWETFVDNLIRCAVCACCPRDS